MAIGITYSPKGLKRAEAALNELRRRGEDFSPVLDDIGSLLHDSTLRRFETARGPDGEAWQPSRRALDEGGVTLTDKGILRGSITWRVIGDAVEIGSNVVYAGIHQHGGAAGRGHAVELPARPFLGVDDDDEGAIEGALMDYLAGAFDGGRALP